MFRSKLKEALDSIELEDPTFPEKLRESEKEDDSYPYQDRRYNMYNSWYFNKFKELKHPNKFKKNRKSRIDPLPLILHFFIRKVLSSGYKALFYRTNTNTPSEEVDIGKLTGRIEDAYMELEKSSHDNRLRRYCLEKVLEFMGKYPEENNKEFIGRRAEAHLDLGRLEKKDTRKKMEHLQQAYNDSLKQIGELGDGSVEALYKLARVCNFFSNLHVEEKLKKDKVETGINVSEKLRAGKTNCMTDNILGFLYLKRANFQNNPNSDKDYDKGISLLKSSLGGMGPYVNARTKFIYGYAGDAFLDAYKIKTRAKGDGKTTLENLEDSDLENLITGLICSESSEKYGNHETENYQAIGRGYYELQFLIEKIDFNRLRNVTQRILSQQNFKNHECNTAMRLVIWEMGMFEHENKFFEDQRQFNKKFEGSGLPPLNLPRITETNPDKMRKSIQSLAICSSLDAFRKSHEGGDNTPDNKSYRGMCLVDLVRLNNRPNRLNKEKLKEMLEEARSLLESALEEKLEEKRKDIHKDYRRLAECEFRLADLTDYPREKKGLYRESIKHNTDAISDLQQKSESVNHEIYSSIASSLYKLAETSKSNEKKQKLKKAVGFFEDAFIAGDESSENRSKKGDCYLKLLEINLTENRYQSRKNLLGLLKSKIREKKIAKLIKKAKVSLEESIKINGRVNGDFIYPYFSLYFISKDVLESGKDPKKYNLKNPEEYAEKALEIYFQKEWDVKRVGKSKNFVFESKDNHGLLEPIFILKCGEYGNLGEEMANVNLLRKSLDEKLGNERKFFTPKPLSVKIRNDKQDFAGAYYIMTRKHGIVLEDILKDEKRTIEEKLNTLENVVDYLAFIHANVPATGEFNIERGKADVGERLKNLEKLEVGYKNEDTLAILENYNLITESIRNSVYVFNKDAHPRNWTIAPNGNIIALDLEGGTIPQAYDLVKLIEHGDYLNEEQKDVLMRTYLKSYTGYKQDSQSVSTFDNFKFQYLNLTLHKALTFVGSWSKEKEDADWNRNILIALKNAQKAFEIIKRNYSNSYSYYEKLQEGVTKIEELLRLDYERRFV